MGTSLPATARRALPAAGGGVVQWLRKAPPTGWFRRSGRASAVVLPAAALLVALLDRPSTGVLTQLFWFFTKAGAFMFGSGLAIVPFL